MSSYPELYKDTIAKGITLVAVSKTRSNSEIMELYNQGQRHFGENRVQELVEKYHSLPKDIHWHAIGHLQKNKVKHIAPFVHLIHSVDSEDLANVINKEAIKHNRNIPVLLQIKIAQEDSKFGIDPKDVNPLYKQISLLPNLQIQGLMGMASFVENEQQIGNEFQSLSSIFDTLKTDNKEINTLSMGMSGDYKIAIENGTTMIRIGSLLFGIRK